MLQEESVFSSPQSCWSRQCPKSHICYHCNEGENRITLNGWASRVHTALCLVSSGKSYEIVVPLLVAFKLYLPFWDDAVMMFSVKIYGFFFFLFYEELEEEGEYALCFSMAKLSHSPVQKGSAGMGTWWLGWHCWKTCLLIQILTLLDK